MKKILLILVSVIVTSAMALGQTVQISGTVTSKEDGLGMAGVTIFVKGTTVGTATNPDGTYSLNVPASATTLVYSFVGYKSVEEQIQGRKSINVVMEQDLLLVDEVIVVAYGTTKKEAFTGSASSVQIDKLGAVQVSNVTKALEGLSSGIQVLSGSGQPGTTTSIRIRGIGSIYASSAPLYVVDGFPFDGDLNSIPQSDIASLTVLKDASATALYGSRAANGVIVITTKKGKTNESQITFNANVGINVRGIPEYDRVSVPEYYQLAWQNIYGAQKYVGATDAAASTAASNNLISLLGGYNAYDVADNAVVGTDGKITSTGKLLWNDNWFDEMHRVGLRQDYTLSASGGKDKSSYYLSANYLKDDGIVKASNYDRFTVRVNADTQAREWLKLGVSASASTSSQNYPNSSGSSYVNSFMWSRMIAPIYPVYLYDLNGVLQRDANGNKIYDYGDSYGRARTYSANSNPLGVIALDKREYLRDIAQTKGYAEISFLKDFKLTVSANANYQGGTNLTHQNSQYGDAQSFAGRTTRSTTRSMIFSANELLTYNKSFGPHNFDVLVGHENYSLRYNYLAATKTGFPFAGLYELDAAATIEGASSYEDNLKMESYLSRVNYNYADKYYLSLSARTDGSSRFAPDYRWGKFWSAGASWRVTQEDFMKGLTWLDDLKLKVSYGSQGNDNLGTYYAYLGLYDLGWNNLDYSGLLASRVATPKLLWEKNKSLNAGVEFSLFKRLTMNIEFYQRKSDDLLFPVPLPYSTGYTSYDANIGAMQNTGVDLEANVVVVEKGKFRWTADINLSHYKNEITKMPPNQPVIISGTKQYKVGHSIYDFYTYHYAGTDPANGAPLWNKTDASTGEITTTNVASQASRYYTGTSSIPDLTGGVTNTFKYGDFDLSVLVTFQTGGQIYDGSYASLMGQTLGTNFHKDQLKAWSATNTTSQIPILRTNTDANATSDRWLTSSDYFSFRNVTLGYNLSKKFASALKVSSARLAVNVTNLHTFTARKGLDPQQSFDGTTDNSYTPLRTSTISLTMNF
jgi:TonB-linked SusC/RagA family outer membrane protein